MYLLIADVFYGLVFLLRQGMFLVCDAFLMFRFVLYRTPDIAYVLFWNKHQTQAFEINTVEVVMIDFHFVSFCVNC